MSVSRKFYKRYPDNWSELRAHLITQRAKNRCECVGRCGSKHGNQAWSRCSHTEGQIQISKKGKEYKVSLQLAHRCRCRPKCGREDHLFILCQSCHLRTDMEMHHGRQKRNRIRKRTEIQPQLF